MEVVTPNGKLSSKPTLVSRFGIVPLSPPTLRRVTKRILVGTRKLRKPFRSSMRGGGGSDGSGTSFRDNQ